MLHVLNLYQTCSFLRGLLLILKFAKKKKKIKKKMEQPRLINIHSSGPHSAAISSLCLGSHTGLVYCTGSIDKMFSVWAIGQNQPYNVFGPLGSYVTASQFDRTEEIVVCGTNGGSTIIYDIANKKSISQWSTTSSTIHSVVFDPTNSENLAISCHDGKVQLLAQKCHAPIQTYQAGQKPIRCVSFSNDGRYIACGGEDCVVNIYDIRNSGVLSYHHLHKDAINVVQFHPTEPILASGGADRSIRFFDFNSNEEMEPVLPLNTAEIKCIRFTQKDNVALSLSSQLLNVVGYNPTETYDRFTFSLGTVYDMQLVNDNIIIASAMRDRIMINRVKRDTLAPFSPYAKRTKEPSRRSDANKDGSPNRRIPADKQTNQPQIPRRKSEGFFRQTTDLATEAFLQFRKERGAYCTKMNERFSRLNRLAELIDSVGVEQAIQSISEGGDLQPEIASVCLDKMKSIKLESATPLMRIGEELFNTDPEVALSLIDAVLARFGKISFATMRTVGSSPELEERKQLCNEMIDAYRSITPKIAAIARENTPLGKTAKEILSDWQRLV